MQVGIVQFIAPACLNYSLLLADLPVHKVVTLPALSPTMETGKYMLVAGFSLL